MKYRRKPSVVEAAQWFPGKEVPGVCLCRGEAKAHVHTAHAGQAVILAAGDYVVPEPDGSGYYPIARVIFEDLYEPAEAGEDPASRVESLVPCPGCGRGWPAKDWYCRACGNRLHPDEG